MENNEAGHCDSNGCYEYCGTIAQSSGSQSNLENFTHINQFLPKYELDNYYCTHPTGNNSGAECSSKITQYHHLTNAEHSARCANFSKAMSSSEKNGISTVYVSGTTDKDSDSCEPVHIAFVETANNTSEYSGKINLMVVTPEDEIHSVSGDPGFFVNIGSEPQVIAYSQPSDLIDLLTPLSGNSPNIGEVSSTSKQKHGTEMAESSIYQNLPRPSSSSSAFIQDMNSDKAVENMEGSFAGDKGYFGLTDSSLTSSESGLRCPVAAADPDNGTRSPGQPEAQAPCNFLHEIPVVETEGSKQPASSGQCLTPTDTSVVPFLLPGIDASVSSSRAGADLGSKQSSGVETSSHLKCIHGAIDTPPSSTINDSVVPSAVRVSDSVKASTEGDNGQAWAACHRINDLLALGTAKHAQDVPSPPATENRGTAASVLAQIPAKNDGKAPLVEIRPYRNRKNSFDNLMNMDDTNENNYHSAFDEPDTRVYAELKDVKKLDRLPIVNVESSGEKLSEIYEKMIAERQILKELSYRKNGNQCETIYADVEGLTRKFPANAAITGMRSEAKPSFFNDAIASRDEAFGASLVEEKYYKHPGLAASRALREQGEKELMAAVEQLDKTVHHLSEMSSENVFREHQSIIDDKDKKDSSREFMPDVKSILVTPNESLRQFSAIHELCQASISPKPKSDEQVFQEVSSSQVNDKIEDLKPYMVNEAINENCNFNCMPDKTGVLAKSFKRSWSSDSHSSSRSSESSILALSDEVNVTDYEYPKEDKNTESREDELSMSEDHNLDNGLVSAVTNVVRRSLRRVKRLRNSFGKARKRTNSDLEGKSEEHRRQDSEELDERRRLPGRPQLGLPSVRSPSTSAVLLPSIVASLAPAVDTAELKISSPRETLTPAQSPRQRRDARRSGPNSFRGPPPLSPARHIPPNLSSSSFRSVSPGSTSPSVSLITNGHRSLCTSPIKGLQTHDAASNTLPNDTRRTSNLLNHSSTSSNHQIPEISLYPNGRPRNDSSVSSASHNRSSSAPDNSFTSTEPSVSHHLSSQSGITSYLVSPLHLPNRNTISPSIRPPSSAARTTSPRRTQRSSDEDTRRSRTPQRTVNRRERSQNGRSGRSHVSPSNVSTSSTNSSRSASHRVSTNPGVSITPAAHSRAPSASCAEDESRRSSAAGSEGRPSESSSSSSSSTSAAGSRTDRGARRRQRPPAVTCAEDQDVWPHHHSGLMASLAVTVTVFNISRFAVLGAAFGWPFLVQWLILSLVLGVPLLTLHVALGQHTGLGALQLWKVAPIFQGVGVSLVLAQLVLGVYCSVPIAWLFVYFNDSFFTDQDAFSWSSCKKLFSGAKCSSEANLSDILPLSVPRYLSWHVQQRNVSSSWQESLGSLKFSLAFNVVIIWLLTFIALCKGNRVYGKVSYVIFIVPLLCFLAVCVYIASWTREDLSLIPDFARAFMNSRSWVAASREVFLVWGLHGPVLQQMTVHNRRGQSIKSHVWLLVLTTVLVLVLASVTGSCCAASFRHIGLKYSPSSFETPDTAQFLVPLRDSSESLDAAEGVQTDVRASSNALAPHGALWEDLYDARAEREGMSGTDDGLIHVLYDKLFYMASQLMVSHMRYDSLYVGIRISYPQLGTLYGLLYDNMLSMEKPDHLAHGPWKRPATTDWSRSPPFRKSRVQDKSRSGYQSLRLATELFPAFVGVHGAEQISMIWAMLFYFSLLLLGIAQQLAVWRTLVEIVISSTGLQRKRGLVTACCCLVGLSAALPLSSQLGPDLLYFLDYIIGCAWWLMILQLVQVFAILFVRGKPVSAQDIVSAIAGGRHASRVPGWSVHISAFACSILVPVGLLVLSISSFKSGQYREVFTWSSNGYWPVWASQVASGLQLLPILLVPLVALAQTCRFLANTRYDLFQRIQLLYRPQFVPRMQHPRPPTPPLSPSRHDLESGEGDASYSAPASPAPYSDPPPKYTPPPSYSTATGLGIAKALNANVRRSIRRLRSSFRQADTSRPRPASLHENGQQIWTTQVHNIPPSQVPETQQPSLNIGDAPSSLHEAPYIPPVDYMGESTELSEDPPPIYQTLDPLSRQKVLKMLQRAGIRRSVHSAARSSGRRSQNDRSDENVLVAPQQTTLELQGLDHLAFDHEIV
ncbi:uncharacterized protein LOC108670774 [Hyalella azteca]|uniref:Uncharacterized protein LOC108670774 n=1 Tax=Hyalella azteca TaxID=294128 RepID=A0A8B7NJC9_HYAAZ|nr:uncharacterized protein LOC108670774 [Hyalella azteca]